MTSDDRRAADDEATALFALKVWGYKQGEVVSMLIHLGDRLGLYLAMDGAGPLTAADLARRTGLHERWLLEWLRGQGAAGLLETTDGEHFELTPEGAAVLAEAADSLWFAAGSFHGMVARPDVLDRLADAFRTGIGLTYDELGPEGAHAVERSLAPWSRLALVPQVIPVYEGLADRLGEGIDVVDVGCGAGVALRALAAAFPASRFEGYDPSAHAIERARAAAEADDLTNLTFRHAAAADLSEAAAFDLAMTLDCLHDMPDPAGAAAAVHRCLRPDGTWLIKEIRAGATWEENQRNPMLALMYGTSIATCLSSAMSEPGGAGLGTLGLDGTRLEAMCRDAGFATFRTHDIGDPVNLYYEVRP